MSISRRKKAHTMLTRMEENEGRTLTGGSILELSFYSRCLSLHLLFLHEKNKHLIVYIHTIVFLSHEAKYKSK